MCIRRLLSFLNRGQATRFQTGSILPVWLQCEGSQLAHPWRIHVWRIILGAVYQYTKGFFESLINYQKMSVVRVSDSKGQALRNSYSFERLTPNSFAGAVGARTQRDATWT